LNPKKAKLFKNGIAEEVGVHPNVVEDFINFYYNELRNILSNLESINVYINGLGTFSIRKTRLEGKIKKYKSFLGNENKTTYIGYKKTEELKEYLKKLERILAEYEILMKEKNDFR